MTRKLLPYEHQLIDALGISKEEYLDFIAAAPVYEDAKEGTVLDVRNAETVAIVLTIVGILFQVAAALLTPKPSIPETRGVGQTRDQRFAPRFGFNGVQELANYGDPIPLVYTNTADNNQGGVRVNTALLWSAVLSFGGNQFMQLMLAIGAGKIGGIDITRTAIGQLPLRDYPQSNIWAYWNPNSNTRYNQLANGNNFADPTRLGSVKRPTARLNTLATTDEFGFSQAYAPTTSAACGVTAVIPINVQVLRIDPSGDRKRSDVGTVLSNVATYWPENGSRRLIPVGTRFTLTIPAAGGNDERAKARRGEASAVFSGARFKIGSAILRVISIAGSDVDISKMTLTLQCERTGKFPGVNYSTKHWLTASADVANKQTKINNNNAQITTLTSDKEVLQSIIDTKSGQRAFYVRQKNVQEVVNRYERFQNGRDFGSEDAQRAIKYINTQTTALNKENAALRAENVRIKAAGAYQRQAYYLKCLAHIEEAHYASTTSCQALDFALKVRAYRRLSGRAEVYGKDQEDYGDSSSDNGLQARTVMFRLYWRFAGARGYVAAPCIFCVRGTSEQDIFTYLKLIYSNIAFTRAYNARYWEVKFEPVLEPKSEVGVTRYCYLNTNGSLRRVNAGDKQVFIQFNGDVYNFTDLLPINKITDDIEEWDLFNYDANSQSQFSYEQGPEVTITAVNEQLLQPWSAYSPTLYDGISTLGLHVFAAKTTESLRSVSAWVTQGKELRRLSTNPALYDSNSEVAALVRRRPSGSSSYASDIFLDTVLDPINGIGQYASIHSVDVPQLARTKRFCVRNRLFMDGIIADQRSWREFWAQTAPFSLLEFAKIGGRDTLVPGVPYDASTGAIDPDIAISALFTAGNILEDSYKEEFIDYGASVQDAIVTAVFRDTTTNDVFPINSSVQVSLRETDADEAVLETLDVSQFVTRREQAILLTKFLCLSKKYIRRAIEFKTFPTDSPVFPGAYIYVEIGMNQWNSIYSGRIEAGGALNAPLPRQVPNGTYTVFVYRGGVGTKQFSNVVVSNGVAAALKSYEDALFVLGKSVKNKRVFRVTEVSMDEEGETTIKAVEHPTDSAGRSLIAQRLISSNQFFVDGALG